MSMQPINEDQYTPAVYYGAGSHTLTKEGIGTRYVLVVVRMLVDPANPQDVQQVHTLQDALKVNQQSPGTFQIPNWDEASLKKVRAALLQFGETISDTRRMFGAKDQVDPVRHLVGTALLWSGNPEKDASTSRSRRPGMTAPPSTGSPSGTCRSTASGQSPFTTPRAIWN